MADDLVGTDLAEAWNDLIDSDAAKEEAVLQGFLERHPSLLPGSRTMDGTSGKPPWPHAVISQPKLTGLSTKVPDFMWIAWDSGTLYPVCIEIETPYKKWWRTNELIQHSDLTAALSQVAHWRRYFDSATGQQKFLEDYQVGRDLCQLAFSPRYVVVHGRRAEASRGRDASETRAHLAPGPDIRLHTFDYLHPDGNAAGYFTVGLDDRGFFVHPNSPPVDEQSLPDEVLRVVRGLERPPAQVRPGHLFTPPGRRS